MRRFLKLVFLMVAVPICWGVGSFLFQRFVYNPIGNPEAKWQIQHLPDSGIVFIGPSVFHQRIDADALEASLGREVHLVTSIGQSTLETVVLSHLVSEGTSPQTALYVAGHDRPILGKGLHQCWHCSNLPFSLIASEWEEVRDCLVFDAFVGLLAAGVPSKHPLPFALDLETMLYNAEWKRSHREYLESQAEVMRSMRTNLVKRPSVPRPHVYSEICAHRPMSLLLPLNGRFYSCPSDFECNCIQTGDSTWIQPDLWVDGGHLSPMGGKKFSLYLEELLNNEESLTSERQSKTKR